MEQVHIQVTKIHKMATVTLLDSFYLRFMKIKNLSFIKFIIAFCFIEKISLKKSWLLHYVYVPLDESSVLT